MTLRSLYEWVEERSRLFRLFVLLLIVASMLLSAAVVYRTGGSFVVYTHTMYVPVVLAGLVFGVWGGVLAALVGGVMLGPFMPLDVVTGTPQSTLNWTFRLIYFLLIAIIVGGSSELIKGYINQIRWRLLHSGTSELPNREALTRAVDRILRQRELTAEEGKKAAAVQSLYLIDIVNLNELSLKLGTDFEPVAIDSIINSLQSRLPADAELYQVRTNRFAILNPASGTEVERELADVVDRVVNTPVNFEGIPLLLHCVWSLVSLDDEDLTANDYMRRLEMALNEAQQRKLHYFKYSRSLSLTSKYNLEILGLLKHALDENSLGLRFQPKYRLSDQSIRGVETLLHWSDPSRGVIPTGEFIGLAENSLLVTPLTLWVVEKAVSELTALEKDGHQLSSIAVNISATNLGHKAFVDGVKDIIQRYQLPAGKLELELTESAVVSDLDVAVAALTELADHGVTISVDDFGTGFSSLQYLDRLPVSAVKIDQSFIRTMLSNDNNRYIVESTVALAHKLGLEVIAEGIESMDVERALLSVDCDYGQGYLFCKPLTMEKLRLFLQQKGEAA